jgi:xanthine dehydrogenase YagR molybdenum-binding subunit
MQSLIGEAVSRVDARLKVSGTARYAAECWIPGLVHAVVVQSTIARGRVREIDTSSALAAPGVLGIITWRNAPRLHFFESNANNRPGQTYLVLQDDQVRYYGQYLAIVIAETGEQAQYAASLLTIHYSAEPSNTDISKVLNRQIKPERITLINAPEVDTRRGDPEASFRSAPIRLDLTYTTPIENQNAMEPHATVASWNGGDLQLIDSTQWVLGTRNMVATHLGIPQERVRILSHFVGGGFGSKGNPWPHPTLAAVAAQHVHRPVKLVLGREQMFSQVGHRPATRQHLCIGAASDGRLLSLSHHVVSGTSQFDNYVESSGTTSRTSYSCVHVNTTHRVVKLDTNTPCPMRAPGEGTGSFALESAMDELAYAVGLDPLALRLRNYAERDEDLNKPFSSKSLRECYAVAAERFGWQKRPPKPRSMRRGGTQIGWGMASAVFLVKLSPASARIRLCPDGNAIIFSATHDIGTGTYTSLAQVAARELQMPLDYVRFELGDTNFPEAPASAGSQTSASVGSAVVLAAREAVQRLIALAVSLPESPLYGVDPSCVMLAGPDLFYPDHPTRRIRWTELLKQVSPRQEFLEVECTWTPPDKEERNWSGWSFGAHFCEVEVDEDLGHARVRRWTAAFAAGRILNEKTAKSQLAGAIVWGISQALLERTIHDDHSGHIVNANLAEYLVPVNADVPSLDISLIAEHDTLVNPLGAKGLGELGICGASAAVANAVYHATGVRCRDLPITVDRFMAH